MDRRSCGKRKSSNCFQRCLTFSFLRFMADPEKKVDSRKLKVKERQNSRKKGHNTENTECRGTKSTEGMTIPGIWAGPKNKNAPTVVGAQLSTGDSLPEPYLVCQEANARKRAEARIGAEAWGAIWKQQRRLARESGRSRRGPDCWNCW